MTAAAPVSFVTGGYGSGVNRPREVEMGLDDMLKDQLRQHAPEIKQQLVKEFDEVTQDDMDKTGDDPDEIVDKVSQKTGQPREQVEQRVQQVAQRTGTR